MPRRKSEGGVQNRSALVIGNAAYKISPLHNPVNDANDIAAALERNGFQVKLLKNGKKRQMEDAIRTFGKKLRNGGVGLFYFAGHGVQYEGRNYLVPVSARIEDEADIEYETVDANKVLSKMELAGNDVNIVILDACRNNPFARSFRSSKQGLAQMDAPTGSLLAYATSPGSVASDGKERNGVYTKYLLQYMDQPGQTLNQLFMKVRRAVLQETGKKQTPWESSSLTGDFYFGGGSIAVDKPDPDPQPEPLMGSLQVKSEPTGAEIFIDGYYEGNAPIILKQIKQGGVAVRAIKKGYTDAEKKVRIRAGRRSEFTLILGKKPMSQKIASHAVPPLVDPVVSDANFTDPTTGMEFVYVKGGCYKMGDTFGDGDSDEKPVHEVCVDGFHIGKYEVTIGQYLSWVKDGGKAPEWLESGSIYNINTGSDDHYKDKGMASANVNHAVTGVSWQNAVNFSSWLQEKSKKGFRLPTEAEWEYAARSGGRKEKYSGSNDVDLVAWYSENSSEKVHAVGGKKQNELGLYDMSGNVWEWCSDWCDKDYYKNSPRNNPENTSRGSYRVIRGGGWGFIPWGVRAAIRYRYEPGIRGSGLGFRLVFPEGSR